MAAPLSEFWAVEYHYTSDSFEMRPLPDYLIQARTAARDGTFLDSVILDLRPTEQGAREQCAAWKTIRSARPLSAQERMNELKFCQSDLEGRVLEPVKRYTAQARAEAATQHWGVEYTFFEDGFFLRPFPDYLMLAQVLWVKRKLLGSVIVAIQQTEQDAAGESKRWKALRDAARHRLSIAERQAQLLPYIAALESQL